MREKTHLRRILIQFFCGKLFCFVFKTLKFIEATFYKVFFFCLICFWLRIFLALRDKIYVFFFSTIFFFLIARSLRPNKCKTRGKKNTFFFFALVLNWNTTEVCCMRERSVVIGSVNPSGKIVVRLWINHKSVINGFWPQKFDLFSFDWRWNDLRIFLSFNFSKILSSSFFLLKSGNCGLISSVF